MMKKIVALFLGLTVGGAGNIVLAQGSPPGFGAVAQYRFGVGARALSMGGAFTALGEGVEALYWNPAGLAWATLSAGGMYTEPFAGLGAGALGFRIQYLGLVAPVREIGLGLGWFNVHVGGIPYTNQGGTFSYDSSVFLGGLAVKGELGEAAVVGAGITAKIYREQMLEGTAQGFGFDLGMVVDFGHWQIGYCSQDVGGTRYHWRGTGQEPLVEIPWVHRVGVAGRWLDGTLLTSGEAVVEAGASPSLRLGVEWAPIMGLALRGGVRLEHVPNVGYQPVWSAGFGVSWGAFLLDAAYLRNPIVGFVGGSDLSADTYVLSLGIQF